MSLSGSLQVSEVSQLINWARQGRRSGAFHFTKEGVRKKLYFSDGRVVGSSSSVPQDWLGHFLVGRGLITELELAKAIELQQESGMLLGSILVTISGISEPQLNQLLVEHCTEILCDLLTWTDGSFEFREDELPRGLVPAEIDIGKALLEGVRRLEVWQKIRQAIPTLDMVPIAIADLETPPDDPVAAQVLSRVDDDRSIQEILLDTHTTEYAGCLTLLRAIEDGAIKLIAPRGPRNAPAEPSPSRQPAPVPQPSDPPPPRRISADDLLACSADAARGGDFEVARRYVEAARCLADSDPSALERLSRIERALPRTGPRHTTEAPSPAPTPRPERKAGGTSPATASPREASGSARPAYRSIPRFTPPAAETGPAEPETNSPPGTTESRAAPETLDKSSVPTLTRSPEEIVGLDLTPEEGFLLTRMDGLMTLGELLAISPMPPDQARRAVSRLVEAGHVELRSK